MHFELASVATQVWKVHTLMVSPSHMELQAHDNISGLLLEQTLKLAAVYYYHLSVIALIPAYPGLTKSLYLLTTATSVILVIMEL